MTSPVKFGTTTLVLLSFLSTTLFACSNQNATISSSPVHEKHSQHDRDRAHEEHHEEHGDKVLLSTSGNYSLELLPVTEKNGIYLDLHIFEGEEKEDIQNAEVTAVVNLPNGEQKTLEFNYYPKTKHYGVLLSPKMTGSYKVVVQTKVEEEELTGQFSCNH